MLKNMMEKSRVTLQSLKSWMLTPKAIVIWASAGFSLLVTTLAASVWINSSKSKKPIINDENQDYKSSSSNNEKIPNNADNKAIETQVTEKLTSSDPLAPAAAAKASVAAPVSGQITANVITAASTTSNSAKNNPFKTEPLLKQNVAILTDRTQTVKTSSINNIACIVPTQWQAPINSNQMEPKSETMIKKPQSITLAVKPLAASSYLLTEVPQASSQLKQILITKPTAVPSTAKLISRDDQKSPALHPEQITINPSASSANDDILSLLGKDERNKSQDDPIAANNCSLITAPQAPKRGKKDQRTKGKEEPPTDLLQFNTEEPAPLASNQAAIAREAAASSARINLLSSRSADEINKSNPQTTTSVMPENSISKILNPSLEEDKALENLPNIDSKESEETPVTRGTETRPVFILEQNVKTSVRAAKALNNSSTREKGEKGENQIEVTQQAPGQTLLTSDVEEKQELKAKKLSLAAAKEGVTVAKAAFSGALGSFRSKPHTRAEKPRAKEMKEKLLQASISSNNIIDNSSSKDHTAIKAEEEELKGDKPSTVKTATSSIIKNPLLRSSIRKKRSVAFEDIHAPVSSATKVITGKIPAEPLSPPQPPARGNSLNSLRAKAAVSSTNKEEVPSVVNLNPSNEKSSSSLRAATNGEVSPVVSMAEDGPVNAVPNELQLWTPKFLSDQAQNLRRIQERLSVLANLPLENGTESRNAIKVIQNEYIPKVRQLMKDLQQLLIEAPPKTETLGRLEELSNQLHKYLVDPKLAKYHAIAKGNVPLLIEGKAIVEPKSPHRNPIYDFIALVYEARIFITDCKQELWQKLELDRRLLYNAKALRSAAEEIKPLILEFKDEPKGKGLSEKQNQERPLVALNNLLLEIEETQSAIFTLDLAKRTQACDKLTQTCDKALENLPNLFKSDFIKKEAYERSIKNVIAIAADIESLVIAPTGDIKQLPAMKAADPAITPSSSTSTIYSDPWETNIGKPLRMEPDAITAPLISLNSSPESSKRVAQDFSRISPPSISKRKAALEEEQSKHTGRLDSPSTNMGQVPTALTQASVELLQGKHASQAVA